jgi:hypothetical protein
MTTLQHTTKIDPEQAGPEFIQARRAPARYRADMASYTLNLDQDPNLQLRIDSFSVPAAARAEFEAAMARNAAFIETLPGFRWHAVFDKVMGNSTFNVVTIAAWESAEAVTNAGGQVRAYYESIGFNPPEMMARLGITADFGSYYAPRDGQ